MIQEWMQTFWGLGGGFLRYVCMDGKVCEGGKGEENLYKNSMKERFLPISSSFPFIFLVTSIQPMLP